MARLPKKIETQSSPWAQHLTWIALGLALALLIARGTMQEFLREPFDVRPGSQAMPRSAGPATSIGLDLLCCLPALLVLLRRSIDKSQTLRSPLSFIPLALLTGWMLLSTSWAADQFGALVTACHWAAAMAMLWAAAQLVRDWVKLRLVAAVIFGLLPIYFIHGLIYERIELPDLIKNVADNREKILKDRDMVEGSFAATHFMDKLQMGELFGFETSPNSFGALLSLLIVASAGLLIQRLSERAPGGLPASARTGGQAARGTSMDPGAIALAIEMILGLWIMAYTRSRTAFATPAIAAVLLLFIWRFRAALARRANAFYIGGVMLFTLGVAAVIGHGLAHGSLVHSSLTFRWQYWVGSVGIFKEHLFRGVGWSNFGLHYLAHRLPQAPEEIKDPHNFIVRFFTELGLVGGLLLVAWQLRLWWELTRPSLPRVDAMPDAEYPGAIKFISAVSGVGILLSLLLGVDLSVGAIDLEIMKRLLFLGAMVIAASLAALRTLHSQEPDDRPAPWLRYSILVGAGVFLFHNLIDFSLFETGPLMVFSMLIGSALGVRQADCPTAVRQSGKATGITFAAAASLWLAAVVRLWGPILQADRAAAAADEAIRTSASTVANATEAAFRAKSLAGAAKLLEEANREVWGLNSDYAYRAAAISPTGWNELIDEAIRENPRDIEYRRFRASGLMNLPTPPAARVKSDYEIAARFDPNNVQLHLEYAGVLAKLGEPAAAREQYEAALRYDNLLNWDEKKRLKAEEIEDIQRKMRALQ